MSGMVLKKGMLSAALRSRFREYYDGLPGVRPGYADARWRQWEEGAQVVTYAAEADGAVAGWIVYDPGTSTIEEILVDGEAQPTEVLFPMVDALLARESLVAAELLDADAERYRWLVQYGFRPTRKFEGPGGSWTKMDLSTVVFFQRLREHRPAEPYTERERVAIERIGGTQTDDDITRALQSLLDRLGGLGKFVRPGQNVVIKPNVVADHGSKDGRSTGGVVTDPRVVRALIELLLPIAGRITVAEGSSINRAETARMFAHYGYDRLTELGGGRVSLVDLNTDRFVEKPVPGGKRMASRRIPVTLEEADVIISLPVMKTHFAAAVSLGVKLLQGAVPPLEKYMSHFFGLWQSLVNIHHLVKPTLTIVDGLTAHEGFGPVYGTPKPMNLFVGGTNVVAVDAVTMRVMGVDPRTSPPVLLAYLQGFGPLEAELIHVVGASVEEVASPFQLAEIDLSSGRDFLIHDEQACDGCRGYLHYAVAKLRRADPQDPKRLLIDRPLEPKVHLHLGPGQDRSVDAEGTHVFIGVCQQHNAARGTHLPGCPPHAEVMMNGVYRLYPDVERPKYADVTQEEKLESMLREVLEGLHS